MENAKKNLVFHFGVGRQASFLKIGYVKDVQMMLKHFFDNSTGFRYKKMGKSSPSIYRDVHVLSYIVANPFEQIPNIFLLSMPRLA